MDASKICPELKDLAEKAGGKARKALEKEGIPVMFTLDVEVITSKKEGDFFKFKFSVSGSTVPKIVFIPINGSSLGKKLEIL